MLHSYPLLNVSEQQSNNHCWAQPLCYLHIPCLILLRQERWNWLLSFLIWYSVSYFPMWNYWLLKWKWKSAAQTSVVYFKSAIYNKIEFKIISEWNNVNVMYVNVLHHYLCIVFNTVVWMWTYFLIISLLHGNEWCHYTCMHKQV